MTKRQARVMQENAIRYIVRTMDGGGTPADWAAIALVSAAWGILCGVKPDLPFFQGTADVGETWWNSSRVRRV